MWGEALAAWAVRLGVQACPMLQLQAVVLLEPHSGVLPLPRDSTSGVGAWGGVVHVLVLAWGGQVGCFVLLGAPSHQEHAVNFRIRAGRRQYFYYACWDCQPMDLEIES